MKLKFILFSFFVNFFAAKLVENDDSLSFLEDKKNLTNLASSPVNDPNRISKVIKIIDDFYEIDSYIKSIENQNYLIMKVHKENSDSESYSFEGTFEQIIKFDSEWKVFKSLEQIFTKIIKVKIIEEKFSLSFEGKDLILQFLVDILGDTTLLKIKLLKEALPNPKDDNLDLKSLTEQMSLMKAKLENLEKQLNSREQQLFCYISEIKKDNYNNIVAKYLNNGDSFEFPLDVSNSGQIKIAHELECGTGNSINSNLFYGITLELISKTEPNKKLEFVLQNQYYSLSSSYNNIPEGGVLSIKNSRTIDVLKGNYTGIVRFFGGKQVGNGMFSSSDCGRLILKRLNY